MQSFRNLAEILPLNTQDVAGLVGLAWDKLTLAEEKLPPQMPKLPPNIISFTEEIPKFLGAGIQLTKHQRDAPTRELFPSIMTVIMLLRHLLRVYGLQPSMRKTLIMTPAWDKARLYHRDLAMKIVITENWGISTRVNSQPKLLRQNGELIMSPSVPLLSFELPTEPKDAH